MNFINNPLNVCDGIPYGVAAWSEEGFGSQRAVVEVDVLALAVQATLPWRRRDHDPEGKDTLVVDAQGNRVLNVLRGHFDRECGEIFFEPTAGLGLYFIYFLPCGGPRLFQDSLYAIWQETASPAWKRAVEAISDVPAAKLLRFEARSEFDRRDPMELIATQREVDDLLARNAPADFLIFPEDRRYPIRMKNDLPYGWAQAGPSDHFEGQVRPGEIYAFQIGLYAARQSLENLTLIAADLLDPDGARIAAEAIECINLGGVDWEGRPFTRTMSVAQGQVGALWVLVETPKNLPPGAYTGDLLLQPTSSNPQSIPAALLHLTLDVAGEPLEEGGCLDDWRHSRLSWLNSTRGNEDTAIAPYQPLQMEGQTVRLLNRSVRFNAYGFPESLVSNGCELLAGPVTFQVEPFSLALAQEALVEQGQARIRRQTLLEGDGFNLKVMAEIEFDGCLEYRIQLEATHALHTEEICLHIPLSSQHTAYFMGLGVRGGTAPRRVDWAWDVNRVTNMLWTGTTQAGLHLNLMHSIDIWPQSYTYLPWGTPHSWDFHGSGRCTFSQEETITHIRAAAGPRDWHPGEVEEYRFRFLITPFKPLDPLQWCYRYSNKTALHLPDPENGPEIGYTIAHLHHGTQRVNPWINYPFLTLDAIHDFREKLIQAGYLDVDVYYTLREISNHMTEIWAMRSLGDEIFISGETVPQDGQALQLYRQGGGYSWLQEHLADGYLRAWLHAYESGDVDAAIATQGLSRLHNFYIEGIDLLMRKTGCGGLYLDGLAFGRGITQRIARVMAANRSDYRIKFHSGNNFDFSDWRSNVLMQYAEHLPYITDLWIGEMFDYNSPPDYWLVEMSGIPFGLTSEMLNYENGGNPWRGMVYAMDGRMHPSAPGLWKVWDEFGIEKAALHGYWEAGCPVQTGREDIRATVYLRPESALVALASWCEETANICLQIDWDALGLCREEAVFTAPEIPAFQPARTFKPGDKIPVAPGQGWLLIIKAI